MTFHDRLVAALVAHGFTLDTRACTDRYTVLRGRHSFAPDHEATYYVGRDRQVPRHPPRRGALMSPLRPIADAPKDGSEFRAVLEETGEIVTALYQTETKWWIGEDRWQDAEGDGAPDGHCRTWSEEDFAGWLE